MTKKEREDLLKEIVDYTPLNPRGRFLLSPRFGKSRLAIELIKVNKPKSILWVTPLAHLAEVEIPEEFMTWKAKRFIPKLTTVTWTSLHKIRGHYDMIILDEEQFATENNLSSLLGKGLTCASLISMTGTASRDFDRQNLYRKLDLQIYYRMSIDEAADLGIISDYKIKVLKIPLGKEKNIQAGNPKNPFMTTEKSQYAYLHRACEQSLEDRDSSMMFKILNRMRAVYNSPSKLTAAEFLKDNIPGRKLFFCATKNQAKAISDNHYFTGTTNKHLLGFLDGSIDDLAMVNKGGVGVTYKNVDNVFLVQVDKDDNGKTSQKICRALLAQKNFSPIIWLLCLEGTQDEVWIESVLTRFNKDKVEYVNLEELEKESHENKQRDLENTSKI